MAAPHKYYFATIENNVYKEFSIIWGKDNDKTVK